MPNCLHSTAEQTAEAPWQPHKALTCVDVKLQLLKQTTEAGMLIIVDGGQHGISGSRDGRGEPSNFEI